MNQLDPLYYHLSEFPTVLASLFPYSSLNALTKLRCCVGSSRQLNPRRRNLLYNCSFIIDISHPLSNSAEIFSPPKIIFNLGHSCLLLSAMHNMWLTVLSSSTVAASTSKVSARLKNDVTSKFSKISSILVMFISTFPAFLRVWVWTLEVT